ncbi:MAG: hypothetical protein Q8P38_04815 [Candidatus Nanopelagicales bacterium]|nr:hypothetical protein [Candidatus Nanopelagicales bacterium]
MSLASPLQGVASPGTSYVAQVLATQAAGETDPTWHWGIHGHSRRSVTQERLLAFARRRLIELMAADSAYRVETLAARTANALLIEIVDADQPTPQVFPAGGNAVKVEWLVNDVEEQITVFPDGGVVWLLDPVGDRPGVDRETALGDPEAVLLIEELKARLDILAQDLAARHPHI